MVDENQRHKEKMQKIKAARDNESAKAGKEIFAKTIKEIYDDTEKA